MDGTRSRLRRRALAFSALSAAALSAAALCFAGAGTPKPPAGGGSETDLERVVRLWAAATGGLDRIRAVRSVRMTGRVTFSGDAPHPIVVEVARPGRIRTEVTFPARPWIQVFDGRQGWTRSPFTKTPEAQPMTSEQLANAPEQADLEGPLVDSARKGIRLAFEGRESVDGRDAWRIRVTRRDGVVRFLDIDATTSLKVRWEGELGAGESRRMNASLFSDYRAVDGLTFPFRIVSGISGGDVGQEIVFDRIEVDPAIPDSDFRPPR
jgi:outer membrane lipoprotein-sorting protein